MGNPYIVHLYLIYIPEGGETNNNKDSKGMIQGPERCGPRTLREWSKDSKGVVQGLKGWGYKDPTGVFQGP